MHRVSEVSEVSNYENVIEAREKELPVSHIVYSRDSEIEGVTKQ